MRDYLDNPNVRHFLTFPAMHETIANAVAVDYLRRMNVDERPKAMRWLKKAHPAIHAIVVREYPHHAA
jgi:hypothetical protein